MLDLMTLGLSMGAQSDLEKMREETGVNTVHSEEQPAEQTVLSQAADVVGSTLNAVENVVSSVASSLVPSTEQVEGAMSVMSAPTIDLSLPTSQKSNK